jgi:hypothetical protein
VNEVRNWFAAQVKVTECRPLIHPDSKCGGGGGSFRIFTILILKCLKCIDGDCTVQARPFGKRVVDK